jgi:deoxyribose-phosphate aldolase
MNIKHYLDSTYLKTPEFAGISNDEDLNIVKDNINEAIYEGFKLIMIRPKHVQLAAEMIAFAKSKVLVGTVIDFPNGESSIEDKITEAKSVIENGADELDFVCNYKAFKNNEIELLKQEIYHCTAFCLSKNKVIKWIIEVAALTDNEIIRLCVLIKNVVIKNFKEDCYPSVFVKSSTGFYKTEVNLPNGATISSIILMLENASPLPIKAAGGVKFRHEAQQMIRLGVKRIGTSAANNMLKINKIEIDY